MKGMMKITPLKNLRLRTGMSLKQFSLYFEISFRTMQNWELGYRQCPEYLLKLMEYKLINEAMTIEPLEEESTNKETIESTTKK